MMTSNYVKTIAEAIRREVPEPLLPPEDTDLLFLFYAVLALVVGEKTSAEDVHDAWTAWMTALGEEHDSMVPYPQLPETVQNEDEPFVWAIRKVARDLQSS